MESLGGGGVGNEYGLSVLKLRPGTQGGCPGGCLLRGSGVHGRGLSGRVSLRLQCLDGVAVQLRRGPAASPGIRPRQGDMRTPIEGREARRVEDVGVSQCR